MLKGIVKQRMASELKSQILAECSTESSTIVATATNATSLLERADYGLMAAIQAAQRSFCLTDPSLPDNPIVFASKGFLELSGYSLGEVLGRNCRFMQGPSTDQSQVDVLRKGILAGVDTSICLLNYKADGTPFYNQIFVAALRDSSKKIINYVGVQVEVGTIVMYNMCLLLMMDVLYAHCVMLHSFRSSLCNRQRTWTMTSLTTT